MLNTQYRSTLVHLSVVNSLLGYYLATITDNYIAIIIFYAYTCRDCTSLKMERQRKKDKMNV